MSFAPVVHFLISLLLAPLLPGVINRTKAFFAGRRGQPLLQAYYDVLKLLRKGAVYSRTTTWVFRAGPMIGLAAALVALIMVPFGGEPGILSFTGDLILFAYLLGLMRFVTVLAALDTGSAFEGMGASREVQFSALAEPAFLLALAALACHTRTFSLSEMLTSISPSAWSAAGPALLLVSIALLAVLLAENARIPVDDPNTHLELTMIHEVMVLDHGGPDFGFILYGAAIKLWAFGSILLSVVLPVRTGSLFSDGLIWVGGMIGVGILIGVIESTMARLRLLRLPQMLLGASALGVLALILVNKS